MRSCIAECEIYGISRQIYRLALLVTRTTAVIRPSLIRHLEAYSTSAAFVVGAFDSLVGSV